MCRCKDADDRALHLDLMPWSLLRSVLIQGTLPDNGVKTTELLTLTKLAGNQASLSSILPHHQSLLEASRTLMTSPALKPSS